MIPPKYTKKESPTTEGKGLLDNNKDTKKQPIIQTSDEFFTQLKVENKNEKNQFPIDVFPPIFKTLLIEAEKSLNFPIDYTGSAILSAVSTAIGKSAKLRVKTSWFEYPALYIAIIGNAGANKSHPIDLMFKPLISIDRENIKEFEPLQNEYEEYQKLPSKEKKAIFPKPQQPKLVKSILHNFTPEVLHKRLAENTRGCSIVSEELATFLEGMNNYSKGDQLSIYLSFWSNKPTSIDRISKPVPLHILEPFLNIIGSIQPRVLPKLFPVNKSDNGFLQRFLFAFPQNAEKKPINENEINHYVIENYNEWVKKYIEDNPISINFETDYNEPTIYYWSDKAKEYFFKWHENNTNEVNANKDTLKAEIITKFDVHFCRLALILHIMNDYHKTLISLEAVKGAELLCNYFLNCSYKVLDILNNSKIEILPENKQKFIEALPTEFLTSQAISIGADYGFNEKAVDRLLSNPSVFKKVSHGKYSKVILNN